MTTIIFESSSPELTEKALTTAALSSGGKLYPAQKRYGSVSDLPPAVKVLPADAQALFLDAFNREWEAKSGDEEDAFRSGWGAVKTRFRRAGNTWVEKMLSPDPAASVAGPWVGDVDQLRRQLVTDGYGEVADRITSQDADASLQAIQQLPEGYRDKIRDRYLHARKDAEGVEEPFTTEIAFKAIVPEKRITYGVVYPANEIDLQKEWARESIIEEAAHAFLEQWRQQDTFHSEQSGAGQPVESFIAPCDLYEFHGKALDEPIRRGSWVMATKWTPEAWELVKSGKIRGYSIGGYKRIVRRPAS